MSTVPNDLDLGDFLRHLVEAQVAEGRHRDAGEILRAAQRLSEERERRLSALRDAIDAGDASGEPKPFDFDAFLDGITPQRT